MATTITLPYTTKDDNRQHEADGSRYFPKRIKWQRSGLLQKFYIQHKPSALKANLLKFYNF